jgi:imidazolonepropionase-like amidohydrolase
MRGRLWLLLLPSLLFILGRTTFGQERKPLVFAHVTVIDGTGAAAQPDMTVIVTGNRISQIGKSGELRAPNNAQVVDASGKFLIPGLWDMHIHWYDKNYLPLFVANGVTGVRVMWGMPMHHQWRKKIESGKLLGPRMYIGSPIVDGPKPFWRGSMSVANAAQGRYAVTKVKQDGADFVKVYSFLTRDAYFAIAEEAKREAIDFEGHVPVAVSAEEASEAGQKSIEHLTGILSACSSREEELLKAAQAEFAQVLASQDPIASLRGPKSSERLRTALGTYDPAKADALFAELKKNHTWQCPTLTVLRSFVSISDPTFTNDPRLKYMPRSVRDSWDPRKDVRLRNRSTAQMETERGVYEKNVEIVGAMQRAGVGILAGTDVLNPYCFPGFSLHDELGLLVRAGLTPIEALQAATLNAARFMGREDDLGTIATGKLADLVLLDRNPLDDISNTKRIDGVVLDGRLYPKAALDDMLTKVEAFAGK